MALNEIEHPAAQELNTIIDAASLGLIQSGLLPRHLKLEYHSPEATGDGAAILRFADWETENAGGIFVPVYSGGDSDYMIVDGDGSKLTDARVKVLDLLGREFPIGVGDEDLPSEYIQFDIVPEGIIFSAKPDKRPCSAYGLYESSLYSDWYHMLWKQGSVGVMHEAAVEFLAAS